ncbi:hypothetical protein RF679_13275 [Undibacterium cyanobacteriorum]|uniref:PsbP C-terminal domain-containing protein n=1 Tax=Undibacterium cyanobacteriorum TaxID=3073561 RepID=A0ABY9RH59_9BURK|nr:hypothetical protein [Undibacterium sp. 20NA77.5]WMW79617.1 hypothetical protein RF679_13275 [Undibacterium sp. 20NA77.5]
MKKHFTLFAPLLLSLSLLATSVQAETIKTAIGTFEVPDGLKILERDEKPDKVTGKPSGIIVFTKANDMPRAVFILSWTAVEVSDKPFDALDSAVKIGNPFNKDLTRKDATQTSIGGVAGGRFEGILPNGLRAVSYSVENSGYRLIVLLKGPNKTPYSELTDSFAKSVENLTWATP